MVGFVNGLPLVVIELKKPGVPARAAFDENLTHYKAEIPQLFWFNALLIASNGTDSRVGSLTADWGRFFEWKRIEREDEPRRVSLEVMLRGTCDRARLLDLVENCTLFSEHKSGLVKIIGQNHQFLGVNNAIASMLAIRGRSAGLRPAAASPAQRAFGKPERVETRARGHRALASPRGRVGTCIWARQGGTLREARPVVGHDDTPAPGDGMQPSFFRTLPRDGHKIVVANGSVRPNLHFS